MTKEDRIKEAYGEYYEDIRLCIDKDGFCELGQKEDNDWGVEPFLDKQELDIVKIDDYSFKWRPKSLQGIETNNGWIKIENEADLPKLFGSDYWVILNDNVNMLNRNMSERNIELWKKNVTHYQPIEKPSLPIY